MIDQEAALELGLELGQTVRVARQPDRPTDEGAVRGGPIAVVPGKEGPPPADVAVTATIVGVARSVSTPNVAGWISPGDLATVVGSEALDRQVLYRIDPSATDAELGAALRSITADLPPDAVSSSHTYLEAKAGVSDTAKLYVPVLLAFAVFALLAAAFTIANVVSGIVLTGWRDIGVLKAVGFTPGQVSATLLGQILAPVAIGTLLGVVIGTVASQPTIERTTQSFGLPPAFTIAPSVLVGVPVACLLTIAVIAALIPAIRAGRLSAVAAMTRGTMPPPIVRPGGSDAAFDYRLPVARPAGPHQWHRPPRARADDARRARRGRGGGDIRPRARLVADPDRAAARPRRGQPRPRPARSTGACSGGRRDHRRDARRRALGRIRQSRGQRRRMDVPFVAYDGDATWIGYELIHGRFFAGPGEVVAGWRSSAKPVFISATRSRSPRQVAR